MEPAKIDWKTIDSVFVKDELYEHIQAPQWVDFSAPHESVDDEAWFCKPDCNHPKTVEDFLKLTPTSKLLSSAGVSETLQLGDWNRRDANLKRRGLAQSSNSSKPLIQFNEDSENQNPNLSTPLNHNTNTKSMKWSTEKKKQMDNSNDETPRLKSTLSARNLFAGRDVLNQITEFCNELKRLATRPKERECVKKKSPIGLKKQLDERGKERKPLLEVSKEKCEAMEKSTDVKEKLRRKKRGDEAENTPISVDLKNIRRREEESLLQIRTCPPSPQCFSATRGPTKTTPPTKASRSRPTERGILQEVQKNKEVTKEEPEDKGNNGSSVPIVAGREAKALDVFWFLKPCTLSS